MFPPSRSHPALLGKGAAWTAAHNAQIVLLGSQWVEPKGLSARRLARYCPRYMPPKNAVVLHGNHRCF